MKSTTRKTNKLLNVKDIIIIMFRAIFEREVREFGKVLKVF
jgi:hypothetical protein